MEQATQGFRANAGADHPYTLVCEEILANVYSSSGAFQQAESVLRGTLERARKRFGPADASVAATAGELGAVLIQEQKWSEAEPILRGSLAVREKVQADAWSTFDTRSMLGASLLGQGKFADAEPLVLGGYEGLNARKRKIHSPFEPRLGEAAARVVRLYEIWGKPDQARMWKNKLGLADLPADVFTRMK